MKKHKNVGKNENNVDYLLKMPITCTYPLSPQIERLRKAER